MNTSTLEQISLDYPFTVAQLRAAADGLTELELRKLCWYACGSDCTPAELRAMATEDGGDIHVMLAGLDYSRGALHDAVGQLRRTLMASRGGRALWWLADRLAAVQVWKR